MKYVLYSLKGGRERYLVRLVGDFIPRVSMSIHEAMRWDTAREAYDWADRLKVFQGWRVGGKWEKGLLRV